MKFKVGDKVRLTRNAIEESARKNWCVNYSAVIGWEVIRTDETQSFISTDELGFPLLNQDLELVPEEPEFEFGEEIEVRDEIGAERKRVIFLCKTTANDTHQYIIADISKKSFDNGARFHNNAWRFARKARPQLSRKEIADKFWVSEDFELIED